MNLLVFFIHFSRRASTYCTRPSIAQVASKQIQHEKATLFRACSLTQVCHLLCASYSSQLELNSATVTLCEGVASKQGGDLGEKRASRASGT